MPYDPNIHHRRSIRLKGYDYSQSGLYFITICVQNRTCLFGDVVVGAPLVGAQNNNTIQNDGDVQNKTGFGIDDGWFDDDNGQPQIGRPQIGWSNIGRPQGHAPTDARNVGTVQNNGAQNGATTDAPKMILNDAGKMVETEWMALKIRFPNIELHEFVVMPNHFHGILQIVDMDNGRPQGNAHTNKTVGDMMDAFKSITTVEYIHGVKQSGWESFNRKLWQRDYWEHIIRDEESYQRISDYIIDNPAKWKNDKFFNQ